MRPWREWIGDVPAWAVLTCLGLFMLYCDSIATYPALRIWPERTQEVRSQPVRFVPDCWHLYDNGHHHEWADCMGVKYYEQD